KFVAGPFPPNSLDLLLQGFIAFFLNELHGGVGRQRRSRNSMGVYGRRHDKNRSKCRNQTIAHNLSPRLKSMNAALLPLVPASAPGEVVAELFPVARVLDGDAGNGLRV